MYHCKENMFYCNPALKFSFNIHMKKKVLKFMCQCIQIYKWLYVLVNVQNTCTCNLYQTALKYSRNTLQINTSDVLRAFLSQYWERKSPPVPFVWLLSLVASPLPLTAHSLFLTRSFCWGKCWWNLVLEPPPVNQFTNICKLVTYNIYQNLQKTYIIK